MVTQSLHRYTPPSLMWGLYTEGDAWVVGECDDPRAQPLHLAWNPARNFYLPATRHATMARAAGVAWRLTTSELHVTPWLRWIPHDDTRATIATTAVDMPLAALHHQHLFAGRCMAIRPDAILLQLWHGGVKWIPLDDTTLFHLPDPLAPLAPEDLHQEPPANLVYHHLPTQLFIPLKRILNTDDMTRRATVVTAYDVTMIVAYERLQLRQRTTVVAAPTHPQSITVEESVWLRTPIDRVATLLDTVRAWRQVVFTVFAHPDGFLHVRVTRHPHAHAPSIGIPSTWSVISAPPEVTGPPILSTEEEVWAGVPLVPDRYGFHGAVLLPGGRDVPASSTPLYYAGRLTVHANLVDEVDDAGAIAIGTVDDTLVAIICTDSLRLTPHPTWPMSYWADVHRSYRFFFTCWGARPTRAWLDIRRRNATPYSETVQARIRTSLQPPTLTSSFYR